MPRFTLGYAMAPLRGCSVRCGSGVPPSRNHGDAPHANAANNGTGAPAVACVRRRARSGLAARGRLLPIRTGRPSPRSAYSSSFTFIFRNQMGTPACLPWDVAGITAHVPDNGTGAPAVACARRRAQHGLAARGRLLPIRTGRPCPYGITPILSPSCSGTRWVRRRVCPGGRCGPSSAACRGPWTARAGLRSRRGWSWPR